jgi:dehydrogenase/reductase SDR family member 12
MTREHRYNEALARALDGLLEASVVGSFSRAGHQIRRRAEEWGDPERLDGKTIIVTGASSGIGQATAIELAGLGAELWLVGRNVGRLRAAGAMAEHAGEKGRIHTAEVDLVSARDVAGFVDRVSSAHSQVHALVHNAGAYFPRYGVADDGTGRLVERTLATHVLAPFRLSWLLSPQLFAAERSVIVTVSSGGMYAQRFDPDHIDVVAEGYRGGVAYARAKRDQVVLSHEWARRWGEFGVASYAMHPGWVHTPGLVRGLPHFAKLRFLLRTPAQGADTVAWLAADEPRRTMASAPTDGLWLDRRRRGEYYLPRTSRSRSESENDGRTLWEWCADRTGLGH